MLQISTKKPFKVLVLSQIHSWNHGKIPSPTFFLPSFLRPRTYSLQSFFHPGHIPCRRFSTQDIFPVVVFTPGTYSLPSFFHPIHFPSRHHAIYVLQKVRLNICATCAMYRRERKLRGDLSRLEKRREGICLGWTNDGREYVLGEKTTG